MFASLNAVNNSSFNTYYSDTVLVYASGLVYAGGCYGDYAAAGAFYLRWGYDATRADSIVGTRLMYLN